MRTTDHIDVPSSNERVAAMRGGDAVGVAPRAWVVVGALGLLVVGALLVISAISAANDNARITRMKDHGVAVTAVVQSCVGNLGGSGSNAANYTCRGRYVVAGTAYDEVIGAMSTFAAPGSHVAAVADPSRPSTIELGTAVASVTASWRAYVAPGLLGLALLALLAGFVRLVRRRKWVRRGVDADTLRR